MLTRRRMACQAVHRALGAYLGGAMPPLERAAVEAHLAQCGACAEAVRAHKRLGAELRAELTAWRPQLSPEASARLQTRVYEGLRSQLKWAGMFQFAGHLAQGLVSVLVILVAVGLWRRAPGPLTAALGAPAGRPLWAAEQGDAQATLVGAGLGPQAPGVAWELNWPARFAGGPVVAADGTVYVATLDRRLLALAPEGQVRWSAHLPAQPAGTPALGADGGLVLADVTGNLMAVAAGGRLRWATTRPPDGALSSPILGPDGTAYYASLRYLHAVAADGRLRWRVALPTDSYVSPLPRLSADAQTVFFADVALAAETGEQLAGPTAEPFDEFVVGADGLVYLREGLRLARWWPGIAAPASATADVGEQLLGDRFPFPTMAGVLPDGRAWMYLFTNDRRHLLWLTPGGASVSMSGPAFELLGHLRPGRVVAVDQAGTVYACKEFFAVPRSFATCYAHPYGAAEPRWQWPLLRLERTVLGGALAGGRLYVVTDSGRLLVLGEAPAPPAPEGADVR